MLRSFICAKLFSAVLRLFPNIADTGRGALPSIVAPLTYACTRCTVTMTHCGIRSMLRSFICIMLLSAGLRPFPLTLLRAALLSIPDPLIMVAPTLGLMCIPLCKAAQVSYLCGPDCHCCCAAAMHDREQWQHIGANTSPRLSLIANVAALLRCCKADVRQDPGKGQAAAGSNHQPT